MTVQPLPRTPRAQVRASILHAAADEFTERGYAAASLAGIARRAGFTKGAVYSNFSSKQDLLVEMLAHRSVEVGRIALTRLAQAPTDRATLPARGAQVLAEHVLADDGHSLLLMELARAAVTDTAAATAYADFRRQQRVALADALGGHLADLGVTDEVDRDHAVFMLVTAMSALAVERAAQPDEVGLERITAALQTVLAGLLA